MDVPTKTSARSARGLTRDHFLAEAVRPRPKHLTFGDGFRLGIGFITAILLVLVLTAGLTWALIVAFKVQV